MGRGRQLDLPLGHNTHCHTHRPRSTERESTVTHGDSESQVTVREMFTEPDAGLSHAQSHTHHQMSL